MGLGILFKVEIEQTFVEVKVCIGEDMSFLDGETFNGGQLPQGFPEVLS